MQIQGFKENAKWYLKECVVSQSDWLKALIYEVIETQNLTKLRDRLISGKIKIK